MTRDVRSGPKTGDRQEWRTPRGLASAIVTRFACDVDVAASRQNTVCDRYVVSPFADQDDVAIGMVGRDALSNPWARWGKSAFCNPPFSSFAAFVGRAIEAHEAGMSVVMFGPISSDTRWYASLVDAGATVFLFRGRVRFEPPPVEGPAVQDKHGPSFPSALYFLCPGEQRRGARGIVPTYVVDPKTFQVL